MSPRAAEAAEDRAERIRRRWADDFEWMAPKGLTIVNAVGEVVAFVLKPPQIRLWRALAAQRAAGQPMRAGVLKARKVGFSTQTQGMIVQRATTRPEHHARIVAQDMDTAGEIYDMGFGMYTRLPADVKPSLAYSTNGLRSKYIQFGEPSLQARRGGQLGLNSKITIDTEKSPSGGRGMTIRSLHLSEVAFWERQGKMLALLNAVPDDPDTLVIVESTANGLNAFWKFWRACEQGNGFYPCFTPWFEENGYRRPFLNDEERAVFESRIGEGMPGELSVGEDEEPALVELMRAKFDEWREEGIHPRDELGEAGDAVEWLRILEHLNWRRWAIAAKCEADVEKFHQEYPSTAEEAFLSTGRAVFDRAQTRRLLSRVRKLDPPAEGTFVAESRRTIKTRIGTVDVPMTVKWVPKSALNAVDRAKARWALWESAAANPDERYIVAADPESGEENEGQTAAHAIVVINHRSLLQVGRWESDLHDPDEAVEQLYMAALYFNKAWVGVEKTGGWGLSWLRWLARDVKYPYTYRTVRKDAATPGEFDNSLGWSTDLATKPLMRDRARELLRGEITGIQDLLLVQQMLTYVMDERGKMQPEPGERSDVLMAWMIAQMIAQEKVPRGGNR